MKSPRFILRENEIKGVFASSRLRHTWKRKVRAKLRSYPLPDPIEHLDFHLDLTENCRQLEQLVCSGHYLPAPAHRILMEKSRGLCRQIVIPHVRDALVLQCLSDALYDDIRGKAPSKRAFLNPRIIRSPRFKNRFSQNPGTAACEHGSTFNESFSSLQKPINT
jgi:hypothetical protein